MAGKIVVCDRGSNNRVNKSAAVKAAGGVGMVLGKFYPPHRGHVYLCEFALAHVERTITHEFLRDTTTASIAVRAPERIEKVLEEAVACRAEALFGLTLYQPGSLNWIPGGSPRIMSSRIERRWRTTRCA